MDQAARGATALAAGNHQEAIKEYSAAIAQNPRAVDYYIKRSTAYQRSSNLEAALDDADHAVLLAMDRGKRELIADAQLRRAIILFTQERYADAGFLFGLVKRLNEKEKTLGIWQLKVEQKLKGLSEEDEKAKVTVKERPEPRKVKPAAEATNESAVNTASSAATISNAGFVVQTPPSKIKHDWYQSNDKVIFTLLAKGVPKDKAQIDIQPNSLSISFPTINTDSSYDFSLDPLFGAIDPSQSSFSITPNKVEVTLKKQVIGQKWHSLEGVAEQSSEVKDLTGASSVSTTSQLPGPNVEKAPAYPTSSRSGPKDWDKVVDDLSSKGKKKEDEAFKDVHGSDNAVDYGDLDEDDAGGDPAGAFFKKLFKNADPDTQRAMMKSYQESNGTVLSTSWAEVGKGKVETQPPDGMEAKQWGK